MKVPQLWPFWYCVLHFCPEINKIYHFKCYEPCIMLLFICCIFWSFNHMHVICHDQINLKFEKRLLPFTSYCTAAEQREITMWGVCHIILSKLIPLKLVVTPYQVIILWQSPVPQASNDYQFLSFNVNLSGMILCYFKFLRAI